MTEYELHRLLVASRAEFDGATALFVAFSLAVMAVGRTGGWTPRSRNWLSGFYTAGALFAASRCLAAMIRFGTQSDLLAAMDPAYDPAFPLLQWPTLVLRLAVFFGAVIATLHCIRARPS